MHRLIPFNTILLLLISFPVHHSHASEFDVVIGDTVSKSRHASLQPDTAPQLKLSPDSALIRLRAAENRYKLTSLFIIPGVIGMVPSVYLLVMSTQLTLGLMDNINNHTSEAPGIDLLFLVPAMAGIVLGAAGIAGSAGCIVAGVISIREYNDCRKKELRLRLTFDFPLRWRTVTARVP
jgi:hypothetical protein